MYDVDPHRLKALRGWKELSQAQLADLSKVSQRQIARIESRQDLVAVQAVTFERLAGALDVDPGVLAGEEPLPSGPSHSELEETRVHPMRLHERRKATRMSREELAEKSGVSVRHIARIESQDELVPVQPRTLQRLARALRVKPTDLTSDGTPLPPVELPLTELRVRMSHETRLNYSLVGRHYGVGEREIATLAPLLFALLAEGSLKWRREAVAEVDKALANLHQMRGEGSQLYFTSLCTDINMGLGAEETSIAKADLLGDLVRGKENELAEWADEVAPFADYLCKLADELEQPEIISFAPNSQWRPDLLYGVDLYGAEPYNLCAKEFREITGGSKHAQWALLSGDTRISEVPKELWLEEAKEQRIKWLEDRLSEDVRKNQEQWEQLMSKVQVEL